ncbi:MAG: hypothetical protein AAGC99_22185, partial [Pseudomonadota bacterium]
MSKGWERLRGYGYRDYYLARRPGGAGIYRCRYNRTTRQVDRVGLNATNPERAQQKLEDWVNVYADMPEADPRSV